MNEKQISQLFNHSINEQFNPIQTFGQRQSAHHRISNGKINLKKNNNLHQFNENGDDKMKEQVYRETRIKLLSSYQQSYLQSVSQPMFTEQDQPSYDSKINKNHNLSYSQSKGYSNKIQNYMHTDPGQDYAQRVSKQAKRNKIPNIIAQKKHETNSFQTQMQAQTKSMLKDLEMQTGKKFQNMNDKIIALQQAIDEELYNLSVQQRLYDYLMARIDERGRFNTTLDDHLVLEKAIDFMDSGEQFIKELIKMKKMQQK